MRLGSVGSLLFLACATMACRGVHHIEVGNFTAADLTQATPISVHATTGGFEAGEAVELLQVPVVSDVVTMVQQGPRVGRPVYDPGFAASIGDSLRAKCPHGEITGVVVKRANDGFWFFGQEYVHVDAFCVEPEVAS